MFIECYQLVITQIVGCGNIICKVGQKTQCPKAGQKEHIVSKAGKKKHIATRLPKRNTLSASGQKNTLSTRLVTETCCAQGSQK